MPVVLTPIDVLSVSKHKCDGFKNNHTIYCCSVFGLTFNDWFITFAWEARGNWLKIGKRRSFFPHFHRRNKVNCIRHVIILAMKRIFVAFFFICYKKNRILSETILSRIFNQKILFLFFNWRWKIIYLHFFCYKFAKHRLI